MGAEPGRGNSHGNPLNRGHNTTYILASHSSHIVSNMVLKSKLECNSQNRSEVIIVQIRLIGWACPTSSHFKCRGQIQCPSSSRSILQYKDMAVTSARQKRKWKVSKNYRKGMQRLWPMKSN